MSSESRCFLAFLDLSNSKRLLAYSLNGCAICLDSLRDKDYATTDNPVDVGSRCCVECLQTWLAKKPRTVIGDVPVSSYSVYSSGGVLLSTRRVLKVDQVSSESSFEIIPNAPPLSSESSFEIIPKAPPLSSESSFEIIPNAPPLSSECSDEDCGATIELQSVKRRWVCRACQCQVTRKSLVCLLVGFLLFVLWLVVFAVTDSMHLMPNTWIFPLIGLACFMVAIIVNGFLSYNEEMRKRDRTIKEFNKLWEV